MREYTVDIYGLPHTVQLSDEDAKRLSAKPVEVSAEAEPAKPVEVSAEAEPAKPVEVKQVTPANKSANAANKG